MGKITFEELQDMFHIEPRSERSRCPRCKSGEKATNKTQVRCGRCGTFIAKKEKP